jgi:hypothetical protein
MHKDVKEWRSLLIEVERCRDRDVIFENPQHLLLAFEVEKSKFISCDEAFPIA